MADVQKRLFGGFLPVPTALLAEVGILFINGDTQDIPCFIYEPGFQ